MGKQKLNKPQKTSTSDSSSFSIVLFYCLLIIFLPILVFFCTKHFIFDELNITSIQSNIYSAILAVIALHVALGLYLYRAYFDDAKEIQKED